MKKQDLYEILDEIFRVDPSLKQDEKKLVEMLTLFSKSSPNVKPSPQFKKELKQVIISEVLKKKEKITFFSYIKLASFVLSWALGVYLSFFIFAPFFNQEAIIVPPENIQTTEETTSEINKENEVIPEINESISSEETVTEDKPESIREEKVEEKPIIVPEVTRQVETEKSVPKEPEVRKTKSFQTTILQKWEIAFWNINEEINRSEVTAQMSLMMTESAVWWAAMDSMTFSKMAPVSDEWNTFIQEAPPEETIPSVEKKYTFKWNLAIKIPEKMNVFKNTYNPWIDFFEEKMNGYTFRYNFSTNLLSIFLEKYQVSVGNNIMKDDVVLENISAFIHKYWIEVSQYWEPEVFFNWVYTDFVPGNERIKEDSEVSIRFPLLIEGKEVYNEWNEQIWAYIVYDNTKNSIVEFLNISNQSKEKSLYPLNQDIKSILKTDEITAWVIYSYESLKNPSLVYLLKNDYYIPALKFTTESGENKVFELVQ